MSLLLQGRYFIQGFRYCIIIHLRAFASVSVYNFDKINKILYYEVIMVYQVVKTKLLPPPVGKILVRGGLIERLNTGIEQQKKLTIITAPAGYGKTTLVISWIRQLEYPVTWMTVDGFDNNLSCFFSCFCCALQKIDVSLCKTLGELLHKPHIPSTDKMMNALVEDLWNWQNAEENRIRRVILIIDDYHLITDQEIHSALKYLISIQPACFHPVIISRKTPPVSIPFLRSKGFVTEIDQDLLSFNDQEVKEYLLLSGLPLPAATSRLLKEKTEGWITGIYLTLQAIGKAGKIDTNGMDNLTGQRLKDLLQRLSSPHHFILDYLFDEVFICQDTQTQKFLMITSCFNRFCAELCDAVLAGLGVSFITGNTLLELEQSNQFIIAMDTEKKWYRYHALFAGLLHSRLKQEHPDWIHTIYMEAALWHKKHGLVSEAIHYSMTAGLHDVTAELIETAFKQLPVWRSSDLAVFLECFSRLPDELKENHPWLKLYCSRIYYIQEKAVLAETLLAELEETLTHQSQEQKDHDLTAIVLADKASYALVRGALTTVKETAAKAIQIKGKDDLPFQMRMHIIMGLACFRAGDMNAAEEHYEAAYSKALSCNLTFAAGTAAFHLGDVEIAMGLYSKAEQSFDRAIEQSRIKDTLLPAAGFAYLGKGRVYFEQYHLEQAKQWIQDGLDLLKQGGITDSFGLGNALLARVLEAMGNHQSAEKVISTALVSSKAMNIQRITVLIESFQALFRLQQAHIKKVLMWAHTYEQHPPTEYMRETEDITLAKVYMASGEYQKAITLLDRLYSAAEEGNRNGILIELSVLMALSYTAVDMKDDAERYCLKALELASTDQILRPFVEAGSAIIPLLNACYPKTPEKVFCAFIFNYFRKQRKEGVKNGQTEKAYPLVEPLSDREMDVLLLLKQRLTNDEIAEKLFISLPTVKTHLQHIFNKLGVHNRKEAVIRAKELHIL